MSIPTHIQMKSMEFVSKAKVVDDPHERGASGLGDSIVEYHNFIFFTVSTIQDCISSKGSLEVIKSKDSEKSHH